VLRSGTNSFIIFNPFYWPTTKKPLVDIKPTAAVYIFPVNLLIISTPMEYTKLKRF
jgi:hypothetical protein